MRILLLILTLFILASCTAFEAHVKEIKDKNRAARLQKFNIQCSGLGLKNGTVAHNVCVDRKKDIYNVKAEAEYKIQSQCIIDGGVWIGYKCKIRK
jgi:hypothetical protein